MRIRVLIVFFTLVTAMIIAGCGQQQVSFSKHVKPILDAKCLSCHDGSGEGSQKSDFIVTSYEAIMKGTHSGSVVVPGSSISSTLYRVVNHKTDTKIQMPPHHDNSVAEGRSVPLVLKEIETIKNWIDQGAEDN